MSLFLGHVLVGVQVVFLLDCPLVLSLLKHRDVRAVLNQKNLISNKFIDIKKGSTLVHKECTRGQTIKNKNCKNLGDQEKIKMIGSAMQPTNPLKF